jgi:hypothetical protein
VSPDRANGIERDDWPVPTPEVLRLLDPGPSWVGPASEEHDLNEARLVED